MDTRLMEYIIMIAEEKSITKAAEKLYLTQSALNQQLQKLERELDIKLFNRNRSDWSLTDAGKIYYEAAKNMIAIKREAYKQIYDLSSLEHRKITVGLIPERGVEMFTSVYPKFHAKYPNIIVEPIESNVLTMKMLISRDEIDLGLVTITDSQKDQNIYHHMTDEEILLAVPDTHPLAAKGSKSPVNAPSTSLANFSKDNFIQIFHQSTMKKVENELFNMAGFKPHVLFSTSSNINKHSMVESGVGCSLIPFFFARESEHIVYFRLDTHPTWEVTICTKNDVYISKPEEYFIELCREFWDSCSKIASGLPA